MQGFVLNVKKIRDEDLLVYVLTEKKLKTLYRFYGARHSQINLGYKIDFSAEPIQNRTLLRLRDVTHLGYGWLKERHRLSVWQTFCALMFEHLKEVTEHGGEPYKILADAAEKIEYSNPKRVIAESYIKLIGNEGRLHRHDICFFCEKPFYEGEKIALARGFLPGHEQCVFTEGFDGAKLADFFDSKISASFNDKEIDAMFSIICHGL